MAHFSFEKIYIQSLYKRSQICDPFVIQITNGIHNLQMDSVRKFNFFFVVII